MTISSSSWFSLARYRSTLFAVANCSISPRLFLPQPFSLQLATVMCRKQIGVIDEPSICGRSLNYPKSGCEERKARNTSPAAFTATPGDAYGPGSTGRRGRYDCGWESRPSIGGPWTSGVRCLFRLAGIFEIDGVDEYMQGLAHLHFCLCTFTATHSRSSTKTRNPEVFEFTKVCQVVRLTLIPTGETSLSIDPHRDQAVRKNKLNAS